MPTPVIKGVSYYCGIAAWGLQWAALLNATTSTATLARITSDMAALKALGADTVSVLLDANDTQCLGGGTMVLGGSTSTVNTDLWAIYQVLSIVKAAGLQAYLRFDWSPAQGGSYNTGSCLTAAAAWMNQVNAVVRAVGVTVPGVSLYNEPNNSTSLSTIVQGGSNQNGSLTSGFAGSGGAQGWADTLMTAALVSGSVNSQSVGNWSATGIGGGRTLMGWSASMENVGSNDDGLWRLREMLNLLYGGGSAQTFTLPDGTTATVNSIQGLTVAPDYMEVHCYLRTQTESWYYTAATIAPLFASAPGALANCPFFIAEFGNATGYAGNAVYPGTSSSASNLYSPQSDSAMGYAVEYFYRIVLLSCNALQLGMPYPWQHSDISIIGLNNPTLGGLSLDGPAYNGTGNCDEYTYGIFTSDGLTAKPSALVMATAWAGGLGATSKYWNYDFETIALDASGNPYPAYWRCQTTADGTITVDSTVQHSGTSAVKLVNTASGAGVTHEIYLTPLATTDTGALALTAPSMSGATVQMWVNSANLPSDAVVELKVVYYTAQRTGLTGSQTTTGPVHTGALGAWAQISVGPLVLPAGAAYYRVYLTTKASTAWGGSAAAWFDDVTLTLPAAAARSYAPRTYAARTYAARVSELLAYSGNPSTGVAAPSIPLLAPH